MNNAAETSRDKGLLENALTMTSFSMPSQADVIDYEITLLTEKQNQIVQHMEELLNEAIERHAELTTVCADIASEVKHYENEYKSAHSAKVNARRFYGENSHQVETYQSKFRFFCEQHSKAKNELDHAELEREEMQTQIQNMRSWLRGVSPQSVTTKSDDLPFENEPTARDMDKAEFDALLPKVVNDNGIQAIERFLQLDIDQIVGDVNAGYNSTKIMICSALGSQVWEHEDLDDNTKEAFEKALAVYFESVEETLEEYVEISHIPTQRQINSVYQRINA